MEDNLTPTGEDLRAIAEGRQPQPWRLTLKHRIYGELTFVGRLPRASDLMRQSVARDQLLAGDQPDDDPRPPANPSEQSLLLATSISGIATLLQLPVLREEREVLDEDNDHERTVRHHYDPGEDLDERFVVQVWLSFSAWRYGFLSDENAEALGNSSGETDGSAPSAPSTAPTVSPSTIPA